MGRYFQSALSLAANPRGHGILIARVACETRLAGAIRVHGEEHLLAGAIARKDNPGYSSGLRLAGGKFLA